MAAMAAIERVKELHADWSRVMDTDPGNVELHAASLAQGIAVLLAEEEAAPSASARNGGDAPQDVGLCAIDEKMATTAVEDDGASSATARDSDGRAKVTLSVSLPLEPAETSGVTADGIEEGQPPSSPSPPLPSPIEPGDYEKRPVRSLSRIGAEPFVLRADSQSSLLMDESVDDLDQRLYVQPTPRTDSDTSPPGRGRHPVVGLMASRLPDGSANGTAEERERVYEERIEELELENMELKKRLAAAQGGGRVSPTPAPTKSASPTGSHVSPTRVSPTLSPQGTGQGGRAKSPPTLSPPAPAPEPEPSPKSPPDPKPRAMRRPGARGPRPGSPGSPAPVKVKGHRRGSTVGLERASKPKRGRRQTRKKARRMSLMSTLSHQGTEKISKVEDMVALLTSVSSARDASHLVSILLHGVVSLGEPHCTSSHLWISALDKTFSADDVGGMEEKDGVHSRFMAALIATPEKGKLNVPQSSFNVLSATVSSHNDTDMVSELEEQQPQSVLAIAVCDSNKLLLAVLELRNSAYRTAALEPAKDFDEQDEELLMPIAAQAGVTLANVLYSDRLASTMQDTDFSTEDMEVLRRQILDSGKEVFQAGATFLAMKDSPTEGLAGRFHDGRKVAIPPSGTSQIVFSSQMASWVENIRAHPDREALESEFCVDEYCEGSETVGLMLHPIVASGQSAGVFGVLHTRTVDAEEEETRMVSFVSQVATLLHNCQLFEKTRAEQEKIQSRMALLGEIKSIGTDGESSDKVFSAIIERTRQVLNADKGRLFMKDPKRDVLWSANEAGVEFPIAEGSGSIQGWVASHSEMVRISDAYADPRFNAAEDSVTHYHTHSVLAVPMRNGKQELTGVIMMVNKRGEGGEFTVDDGELLTTIAAQAGVTLTNAQMLDVAKRDQSNFHEMLDISNKLSSNLELGALIKNITASARKLLDCERGTLFMVSEDKRELYTKIAEGLEEHSKMKEIRIPINTGIAGAAATQKKIINIPEAYEDSRFNRDSDVKSGFRTRSILAVPICKANGEVMGVAQMLNKNGREGVFDVGDENLLKAFGSQAAVSLENSKLFNEALETRTFLQSVLRSVSNLVLAFDEKGSYMVSNHSIEKYFGVTEQSVARQHFSDWLGSWPVLVSDIEKCMEEESEIGGQPLEIQTHGASSSSLTMTYTVSPLTYPKKGMDEEEAMRVAAAASDEGSPPGASPRGRRMRRTSSTARDGTRDSRESVVAEQVRGCVVVFDDLTAEKRMKSTLGRYLNPQLVTEVLRSENALGGVKQQATILFSDIRSFTSISESMDAVDLVAMLNEYFTWEIPPIFDNQGVLDKFIGDAIMAVFGVPFASKDGGATDARRSCRAALQMITQLRKFNHQRKKKGLAGFQVGLGLNTGKVISGNIGSEKRMEYTVIGDAVNLASRLEGITKTYGVEIVISEYTHALVHEYFDCRELDAVAVKGKAKGIRIFELLREKEGRAFDQHAKLEQLMQARVAGQAPSPRGPRLEATKASPAATSGDGMVASIDWAAEGLDLTDKRPIYDHVERFEKGLRLYREEKFPEAQKQFMAVSRLCGGDKPSELYLTRCQEYMVTSPSVHLGRQWDGVYRPTTK